MKKNIVIIFAIVLFLIIGCNSNKRPSIIRMDVMFCPYLIDFQGVDCEYIFEYKLSRDTSITDKGFLDTINQLIDKLEVINADSVFNVYSYNKCKLVYSNDSIKILNLGLYRGTCLDGNKMKDSPNLTRSIREKIGFYNYFDSTALKYFDEYGQK